MVLGEERENKTHHLAIDEGSNQRATVFLRRRQDLAGGARRAPNVRLDRLALAVLLDILQQPDLDSRHRHLPLRGWKEEHLHASRRAHARNCKSSDFIIHIHPSFMLSQTLPNSSMDPGPKPA